jgi:DNA-binding response OmpR family regulator
LNLGFEDYLTKPLNIENFLKIIDKLLLWYNFLEY